MKIERLCPVRNRADFPVIAPSLLSANFAALGTDARRVVRAGCWWLHLDVMDNHFVPNLTFGPPVIKSLRAVVKKACFDAHLMVQNPESLVKPCAEAGVNLLTFHYEACPDSVVPLIESIRCHNMQVGISIRPGTPVARIEPYLRIVDLVLVMTVEPGFGGQALIPSCLNKIRTLRRLRDKQRAKFLIQVDGGINESTIGLAVVAGAEILVAGTAVFSDGDIWGNLNRLGNEVKRILKGASS